jgi:outer membrane protein assembly factor BamD
VRAAVVGLAGFGYVPGPMRLTAVLLGLSLLACGSSRVSLGGELTYGKNAEENYVAGEQELKAGNHAEAVKFFEHVRTKFPFSKYAALSELRLADVKFDEERWAEAAEAYKEFVKLRPNHERVDDAAFRAGLAHWKDGPSTFVLFPPSHEKDQQAVREAEAAFATFVQNYPGSKHAAEARDLLARARAQLAEHEWYVAEFYRKRGHWAGAAGRFDALVKKYPGSPREAEALFRLAEAYGKLDERFRAQQALQELIQKHPESPRRADAERLLAQLR